MLESVTTLVHDQVTTSEPRVLPAYSAVDEIRAAPTQPSGQTQPQEASKGGSSTNFIHDVQLPHNEQTKEAVQPTTTGVSRTIDTIQGPKYVTPLERLQEEPAWIDCPFCRQMTQTKVNHNDSNTTQIYGFLCCLFCGVIGVCVPYLCHWAQETDHLCSRCGNRVTHKPHDGPVQKMEPPQAQLVPSAYAGTTQLVPSAYIGTGTTAPATGSIPPTGVKDEIGRTESATGRSSQPELKEKQ